MSHISWLNPYSLYLKAKNYILLPEYYASFYTDTLRNTQEVRTPQWLAVNGEIPEWFNGILFRIGPGKYNLLREDGSTLAIKHAFDGMPYMHRFEISSKKQSIRYNSRNIAEDAEKEVIKNNAKGMVFFGHVPTYNSFWERITSIYMRIDKMILHPPVLENASPSSVMVGVTPTPNFPLPEIYTAADRMNNEDMRVLVAKTDANILQQINQDTLEPKRAFNYTKYDERIKGVMAPAHHQYDPITKETINFVVNIEPVEYTVFSITPEGKTTILASFNHRLDAERTPIQPVYAHAFSITKDYIILIESPLVLTNRGLDFVFTGSITSSMTWNHEAPAYMHVISRHGKGLVASVATDSFFTFHVANAWDSVDSEGRSVIDMDVCAFDDADILSKIHSFSNPVRQSDYDAHMEKKKNSKPMPSKFNGMSAPSPQTSFGDLRRYCITLDGDKSKVSSRLITKNIEFPRYSQEYAMTKSSFVYGCQYFPVNKDSNESVLLAKVDLDSGDLLCYGNDGYICSEPIFAPRPGSTDEDDGVLMSLVNRFDKVDSERDRCMLVILDAKTMKELSSCEIGNFVASTFHGSYVDHHFENVSVN
ncbi:putative carotene-dioxygenase [Spinellus fusiger]|nr:putative carotene-dioxygenase [Spinellus fusiger]